MKKKLTVILSLVMAVLLMAVSCTADDKTIGSGAGAGVVPGSGDTDKDGLIFNSSTKVAIVSAEKDLPAELIESLWQNIQTVQIPEIITDQDSERAHEIVIGRTSRKISEDAYRRLENKAGDSEYAQFLIYSNGSSVAIAYEDNEYARDMAVEYFIENYLKSSSLTLKAGIIFSTDIVTLQEEYDIELIKEYWSAVEGQLGAEVTSALKEHYAIYGDDLISWYANLYEPSVCICDGECQNTLYCGGGGYYYSNSARNTPGYLPDLESTAHCLNFIKSSGMSEGREYAELIPEWMQEQIVRFTKSRQDENGYFYHPQWTKEEVDAQLTRRSRDLDWATSILWNFGVSPTYDTPSGEEGDGLRWDGTPVSSEALTGRLSYNSSVSAASYVVTKLTAATYPAILESAETFRAYLDAQDIENRSYHVGSELTALVDEINARDKVIGGGGHPLADTLVEYLNEHQKENGLWSNTVNYYAVNGLFKITGCYTNTGHPMPRTDKALVAAIDAITSDEEPSAVVDIYNTWYTINNILENIEKCQGADALSVAEEAMAELRANAVRAIRATTEKLGLFRKDDGSFSYNQTSSSSTSSGLSVAVPNTNEGDENATVIATTGTTVRMMKVLGVDLDNRYYAYDYVPLYTKSDWMRYESILEKLGPVIKDEEQKPIFITFTDETLGELPSSVDYGDYKDGVSVIRDPIEGSSRGYVLEVNSEVGLYNSITVNNANKAYNKACYIFEGDICIPNSTGGYVVRLRMTDLYAFAFKVSDGMINIWDVSTSSGSNLVETDLGISIPLGEWFSIRVEYYKGDHDSVRMKLYINDELAAVNDNYYDQYGKKVTSDDGRGVPGTTYNYFSFSTMTNSNTRILLDNLCCYSSSSRYEAYTDTEKPLKVNVDLPDPGEIIYDFEDLAVGENYPADFAVSGSGAVITEDGGDKLLKLSNNSSALSVSIPQNRRAYKTNVYIAELTVKLGEADAGGALRLALGEGGSPENSIVLFDLAVVERGGVKYLTLADAHDGNTGTALSGIKIPEGEEAKLTLEYYADQSTTVIYINGSPAAASRGVTASSGNTEFSCLTLSYVGETAMNIGIDDLKAESVSKEFDPSLISVGEEKKYTFDDSSSSLDGASVVAQGGDKYAGVSADGSLTIPVNIRSLLYSMISLDTALSGGEGEWTLSFCDENQDTVLSLLLSVSEGRMYIYPVTASGVSSLPSVELDCSSEISLNINWYRDFKVADVYLNGERAAVISDYYSEGTAGSFVTSITFKGLGGSGTLYLDDIIAESVTGPEEMTGEVTEILDFENGLINEATVLGQGAVNGSTLAVKNDGTGNKLLVFTTGATNSLDNQLNVTFTNEEESYNAIVFEADITLECSRSGDHNYFRFKSGSSRASFVAVTDNNVIVYYSGGSKTVGQLNSVGSTKLRIEYGSISSSIFLKVFIDGACVYAEDNYLDPDNNRIAMSAITHMEISTWRTNVVSTFDNVKLLKTTVDTSVKPEIVEIPGTDKGEGSLDGNTYTFENGYLPSSFGYQGDDGVFRTLDTDDHGKVLAFDSLTYGKSGTYNLKMPVEAVSGGTKVVFETDIYLVDTSDSALSSSAAFEFKFTDGDKRIVKVCMGKSGELRAYYGDTSSAVVTTFATKTWYRLKIEYYTSDSGYGLKVYIDGEAKYSSEAYDFTSNAASDKSISSVKKLDILTYGRITAYFDNMVFTQE